MTKVETYLNAIDELGMHQVWYNLVNSPLPVEAYGELYEIGLAHLNKDSKKSMGKYFTPDDVATLMSKWLIPLNGSNVCDVCCGVGNLTLAYLNSLGLEKTRELVLSDRLWLYDIDGLAIKIALESICKKFGEDLRTHIHLVRGDFLDKNIHLPEDSKVISNPPYAKVEIVPGNWNRTAIVDETQELYAAIMEKIMDESRSSVMITPQNYLGRGKFSSLREKLSGSYSGIIVPFDNTPGQVFNGRKHGVFNSNTQNQVRPAILVSDNRNHNIGLRIAGMVRFRNGERDKVLQPEFLESMVGKNTQRPGTGRYAKCFPQLEPLLFAWQTKAMGEKFGNYICGDGDYCLNFVTTCRYNTVAYVSDLFRSGKRRITFKDEEIRDLAYCWLNSSFCYWHWRLYDGEITYQQEMLNEMPVFFQRLHSDTKRLLVSIAREMQSIESSHIVRKKNSGKMMENIKFPDEYRTKIDNILLLQGLGVKCDGHDFDLIHAHSVFS